VTSNEMWPEPLSRNGRVLRKTEDRRNVPQFFDEWRLVNVRPVPPVFSYQLSAKYLSEIAVRASFGLLWCSLYIASISRMKIDVLLRRSS
jgi:hypothetical protein